MNRVQWLLVGAGEISKRRVAAALLQAKASQLTAICSKTQQHARLLAEQYEVTEVFPDFTEALSRTSADAVYLATPVWLHVPQAVQALEAGKHVLVEKPLGLNASECSRVVAAAQANQKLAACAYYRRCYPRYAYTQTALQKGELGKIVSVHMTYCSQFNPGPNDPKAWRVSSAKAGGGPLYDMGSHMFDVMIGLLGLPESVYAKCANVAHKWDVEDSAVVVMTLKGGALAESRFNWNSKTWRHDFEIVGTEAKIEWSPYDSGPVVKTVAGEKEYLDLPAPQNVHLPLIEDFVDSVLTTRSPLTAVSEAIKVNILLDAIYSSARSGAEVQIS
ncbi:MAG TPA: Gfo/Idh/MocA family oxidoreductase [Candidatus Dormibacteraeota bacterium]|nr:Gfo/Idh/MocA family oxidoreductase [Candidatus Dormibacteraeota bacterium]